jgi:hypothetical protein
MISLAFLIAALVLFILAALGVPGGKFNLTSAGLACATVSFLLLRF